MRYICSLSEQDFTRGETYTRTRRPVEFAETITPEAYTSADFSAVERQRVFASGWVAAGPSALLREPGQLLVADVAGRSVIVVRGLDGALHGFYNTCRHRGTRLLPPGAGRVRRSIRCPYHSWAYALDGACIGTPLCSRADASATASRSPCTASRTSSSTAWSACGASRRATNGR